ncbi:MAG: hypothetical protein MUP58_03665 [Candidatus Nanohaloarchaeota archaeon QJJ-9]|nr:hypothetical protein [Candidatus Nanohaloarchaeota archaeon QJJ-9]
MEEILEEPVDNLENKTVDEKIYELKLSDRYKKEEDYGEPESHPANSYSEPGRNHIVH